jgi:dienelactone hydrolase
VASGAHGAALHDMIRVDHDHFAPPVAPATVQQMFGANSRHLALWQRYKRHGPPDTPLAEARASHKSQVSKADNVGGVEPPPKDLFSLVAFPSPVGELPAYVGVPPGPGRHPAIIWLSGGFPAGGAGEGAWQPKPADNDQGASAYRRAGVVMMYPVLRGSQGAPGRQQGFLGEADDVIAAAAFLATQPHVDPDRIYLGGHSTGGTLALLVAASTDRFRGVFAFGPVADPADYGEGTALHDPTDQVESRLRAPVFHLDGLSTPTWIIEGREGNIDSLLELLAVGYTNKALHGVIVEGADHFSVLGPVNALLAERVAKHRGEGALELSASDVQRAFDAR